MNFRKKKTPRGTPVTAPFPSDSSPNRKKHRADDKQYEDQQGDSDDQQCDFKGLVHSLTSVAILNYNLGSGNFLHERAADLHRSAALTGKVTFDAR